MFGARAFFEQIGKSIVPQWSLITKNLGYRQSYRHQLVVAMIVDAYRARIVAQSWGRTRRGGYISVLTDTEITTTPPARSNLKALADQ